MQDQTFEALATQPITGDQPAGEDARYEPEYASILEEIEKLSFSGQGTPVSWVAVEKNALVVLAEKSKDFQIASYLGVALWQNHGLDGLANGIQVLAGLLENFWETGWPALKRIRGRVNAIDWWHERTYGFLQEQGTSGTPVPAERHRELLALIARLDELVGSLMPDASPLRDLTAAAGRLNVAREAAPPDSPASQELPPEQLAPEQPPQPASQTQTGQQPEAQPQKAAPVQTAPAQAAPVQAAPAQAAPDTGDVALLFRHFAAAGHAYLAPARGANPSRAMLWQLSRLLVWGGITALPAATEGETLLPVPDMGILERARQKLGAPESTLQAALEAEDFFVTAPFCLDSQEIIHTALLALGPDFADAAAAVAGETASFVSHLAGVENLTFTDGTPFASPGTIAWLRGLGQPGAPKAAGPAAGFASGPVSGPVSGLASGNTAPASLLAELQNLERTRTGSLLDNLRLNVRQLRLLWEHGQTTAAIPLAEALFLEITGRDLDSWDPPLALETLVLVRNVFAMAGHEAELREARRRIARICPAAALE